MIQAALVIPGGYGAIIWESEEFVGVCESSETEAEVILRFQPFNRCALAIKAALLSQLTPLLDKLAHSLARI